MGRAGCGLQLVRQDDCSTLHTSAANTTGGQLPRMGGTQHGQYHDSLLPHKPEGDWSVWKTLRTCDHAALRRARTLCILRYCCSWPTCALPNMLQDQRSP